VLAIELLCAAQALEFRKPLRPGRGVQRAYEVLRERIGALEDDRVLGPEIEAAAALVREGVFAEI
jgi:histidine ammonia-lyase